jgi:uncharacterized lipoprotein YmbA
MMRIGRAVGVTGLALALAACASAPLHYYTLVAPAADVPVAAPAAAALPFELLAVSVPAQVDQPQLVVRRGEQGVVLLDGERWVAPLGDEVRSALAADLAQQLRSQDMSGLPDNDKPRLRIRLDLRRFDSQPGSYALLEGSWNVRLLHGARPGALTCSSRIHETVGAGYDALVQGHQRALGQLAAQMAAVAQALGAGQPAVCPAE